jgi:hypothetical protein
MFATPLSTQQAAAAIAIGETLIAVVYLMYFAQM